MLVGVGQDDQNNAYTFEELDIARCGPEIELEVGLLAVDIKYILFQKRI